MCHNCRFGFDIGDDHDKHDECDVCPDDLYQVCWAEFARLSVEKAAAKEERHDP